MNLHRYFCASSSFFFVVAHPRKYAHTKTHTRTNSQLSTFTCSSFARIIRLVAGPRRRRRVVSLDGLEELRTNTQRFFLLGAGISTDLLLLLLPQLLLLPLLFFIYFFLAFFKTLVFPCRDCCSCTTNLETYLLKENEKKGGISKATSVLGFRKEVGNRTKVNVFL